MASPTDAWAVGYSNSSNTLLVAHWNGKTWSRDTSVIKVKGSLAGVVAMGGDVWVAANLAYKGVGIAAMLHRTAGVWYVVGVPASGCGSSFAALSRDNIWADCGAGLVHWNGTIWKTKAVPSWASQDYIAGLASASDSGVWAIGEDFNFK
jgi:hypothetical protein